MGNAQQHGAGDRLGVWLTLAASGALAAPALVFAYLPMTDLPQHLAVASILQNFDDPSFGFSSYYEPVGNPALYALSYAFQYRLVRALATFVSLEQAMRGFVFLSLLAYPVGVLCLLRAQRKPALLALLALPLVYNRAFFWGFASFNLAVGLALCACALLGRPRPTRASDLGLLLLCALLAFTHVYGLAVLFGYAGLWLVLGERRRLLRRAWLMTPALAGAGLWLWAARDAQGFSFTTFPALGARLRELPGAILGGHPGPSDTLLLLGFAAALLALSPLLRGPRRARPTHAEAVLYAFSLVNLALYLGLPEHTQTTMYLHVRHAFLALAVLPAALPSQPFGVRLDARLAGVLALVAATLGLGWSQLARFDREARSFEPVVERLPRNPKLFSLTADPHGEVTRTGAYLHFAAYAQARRGGVVSLTFPQVFWNLPLRMRLDAGVPLPASASPWKALRSDPRRIFAFYDFILFRGRDPAARALEGLPDFPYDSVYAAPPWRLYRHRRASRRRESGP